MQSVHSMSNIFRETTKKKKKMLGTYRLGYATGEIDGNRWIKNIKNLTADISISTETHAV